MKRFNYDDNDDFQEPDFFSETDDDDEDGDESEMSDEDYASLMDRREAIDLMQLDLVQADMNQRLLFKTIKMLEKTWLWKFRSETSRLKMIADNYNILKSLVQLSQPEMEEKEEE